MQFRRFVSTEAAAAWRSKVGKYINPTRNSELFDYQNQIKIIRKSIRDSSSNELSKSEVENLRRAAHHDETETKWTVKIDQVKKNIEEAVVRSGDKWAPKDHPCRPTVDHSKTEEQRLVGQRNLEKTLNKNLLMRRKYLKVLDHISEDFITRDNLESKIEQAISNPTSFNITAERLIAQERLLKAKLQSLKVPSEP